jgi:hypothetical protein
MANTVERCYLLEIPVELRLHIYGLLLKPSEIEVTSSDTPSILTLSKETVEKTRFHVLRASRNLHINILSTCHQLHNEATPLLYQPLSLTLKPSCGEMDSHGRTFNVQRLSHMNKIDTLLIDLITTDETVLEDKAHSEILAGNLPEQLEVSTFTLELVCGETRSPEVAAAALQTASVRYLSRLRVASCRLTIDAGLGGITYSKSTADSQWTVAKASNSKKGKTMSTNPPRPAQLTSATRVWQHL